MNVVGVGTDIVEIARVADMIEKHGELFLGRVYTVEEIRYSSARAHSVQHFAGRWAAKEAVLKALGTGWAKGIKWTDMEVVNQGGGKPNLHLSGRAREVADEIGIDQVMISMSHSKSHAIAFAMAVSNPLSNDVS